jgi:SAM-dependent methyltransferase
MAINYSHNRLVNDVNERKHILDLLKLIKKSYSISNYIVAEFGCGMGQNLEVFKIDNNVLGFEGLEEVADLVNKKGIETKVVNLEEKLTYLESSSVDLVLCLDVLEHINNAQQLVKEFNRILSKNGNVIINVPNQLSLIGRLKILFGSGMDNCNFFPDVNEWENPHIRFYTHKGIKDLFISNGYAIKYDYSRELLDIITRNRFKRFLNGFLSKVSIQLFCPGFFILFEKIDS